MQITLEFLSKLFPFKSLKEGTLGTIFADIEYSVGHFSRGELILPSEERGSAVGFVIDGECTVETREGDGAVTLNRVGRHGSFGILSVIGEGLDFPTRIHAHTACDVLFISSDEMLGIIKKYPSVSMNVIRFLANRIAFLNSRIKTFSERTTEQKLCAYLSIKSGECGDRIDISKTRIAKEIGVGRASLYRDLESLEAKGIIALDKKAIIIISPEGLERIKQ